MKTAPTDLQEAAVAMTAQDLQDGDRKMITNRTDVIHDQATADVLPMPTIVTVTAHDPVLPKAETTRPRNGIRTKHSNTPRSMLIRGFFLVLNSHKG